MKFIIGKKLGMTQIFDTAGTCVPVTVLEAGPCKVIQVKTKEKDGYSAVKVGFGVVKKEKNLNKSYKGQFIKVNIPVLENLVEFRIDTTDGYEIGKEIKADIFKAEEHVDIAGISKAKGFQGTVKRHHFGGGPRTHGQSDRQRAPGSIGSSSFPSRVFKGMKMAGRMGGEQITTQNVRIVKVDPEQNLIFIQGSVPGSDEHMVWLTTTIKKVKEHHVQPHPQAHKEEKKDKKKDKDKDKEKEVKK